MSDEKSPPIGAVESGERETIAETENVIETYQVTAEWIRFADAKAAVVLTVNGALASVLIPTLKPMIEAWSKGPAPDPLWKFATIGCLVLWGLFALVSSIAAFRCIMPYRTKGDRHPAIEHCKHFHSAAIAASYAPEDVKRFQEEFTKLGVEGFQREVLAGLLIDAHISNHKYGHVSKAIRMLTGSAIPGFLYLLLTQF